MPFVASNLSGDAGRAWAIGPKKIQLMSWAAASGDTTGTLTADSLVRIDQVILVGLTQGSQPVITGNSATVAFTNPAATVVGQIIVIGV